MTDDGRQAQPSSPRSGGHWLRSRNALALLGFLVVTGFFLVTEHAAHGFGVLPFLLLLACPFLHLFMHGGHGGHGGYGCSPGADESQR